MFTIADPFGPGTGPDRTGAAANTNLAGGAAGHCTMDTFQVTGSGGASPIICGSNDGQHSEFTGFFLLNQLAIYSGVQIRWQRVFWAENQGNHQNFDTSLLTYKC